MPATTAPETLEHLARQVARLVPDRRDPERFHIEKSEVVAELRKLARKLTGEDQCG